MKQIDIREGARRQHISISLFCVIQCWIRNLDGITLSREDLERLLGLERFKQKRLEWLVEDLSEFFPNHKIFKYADDSFAYLTVSRFPIDDNLRRNRFDMWERPKASELAELYEGFLPFFDDYVNYDERLLSSYLALLSQGQISPRSISSLCED